MSSGGLFTLIANDGNADNLIMATNFLKKRIAHITCEKQKMNVQDPTPYLSDIEKTHVLFVNAHFKPYVPMAMEYSTFSTNSGSVACGQLAQFSIPQYGDFFHDMVFYCETSSVSAPSGPLPALPDNETIGDGSTLRTLTSYRYVDQAGNVVEPGTTVSNNIRYHMYPAIRLIKNISFKINGNPLDSIDREHGVVKLNYHIPLGKEKSFNELSGQQMEQTATGNLMQDSTGNNLKIKQKFVSGAQTGKATQPGLKLWRTLDFWFSDDVRLAVPSVAIPYGQRFIDIQFDTEENILSIEPSNIFLEKTVFDGVLTAVDTGPYLSYSIKVTKEPVLIPTATAIPKLSLSNGQIFYNNIFLDQAIHRIYISKIGFSLIRVHNIQKQIQTTAKQQVQLTQFKWPTEQIYFGMRDTNLDNHPDHWWKFSTITEKSFNELRSTKHPIETTATTVETMLYADQIIESGSYKFTEENPIIQKITLAIHGNKIYDDYSIDFFNKYVPYHYGSSEHIVSPKTNGLGMITFALYPGEYQPSGHINISRVREFFINYDAPIIGAAGGIQSASFIATSVAINFLLIDEGSAVLRYST
jgi:hypothetical protein